jgi:diguanylate cyclase (GGDEF)-like protein/PAS domain S-box-containing protein
MNFSHPLTIWRELAKFLPSFIAVVFLALYGSGSAQALTSADQSTASAQKSHPAIQVQKDTLVVGSEQDYPPFSTGLTDATAGGFTLDLWKAVAAEAGLNFTIRVRPFHQILQEFKEGKIDVLINLAQSDERHQFADFTVPHVVVNGAIFVRKGESEIGTEDDLAGKSIIVLKADLAHDYAVSKGWANQLVLVDTSEDGLRLLASGKHDAMLLSKLAGIQTMQMAHLSNIEALKVKAGFSQKFAFAVHKGQPDLLAKVNEGLAITKSNGTYNALYDKWFGVFEVKEVGLRDLLTYIIPIVLPFLVIGGYFFYRRQIERKESEAKLRTLYTAIEQSPASVVITDSEARVQYVNPRFTEASGYSSAETIGQNPRILKSGQTAEKIYLELWTKLSSGQTWQGELLNKRKNGEFYWEEVHIAPVKNSAGVVTNYVAVKTDISERKRVEHNLNSMTKMLRDSQQLLDSIVEHIPVMVFVKRANDLSFEMFNRAGEKLLGYSRSDMLGKGAYDFWSKEQADLFIAADREVLASDEVLDIPDEVIRIANGETRHLHTWKVALRDEGGEPTHLLGISIDITEHKLNQQRLEHALAQQKAILENDLIGIVTVNNRVIVWANPAFEKMLGYGQGELVGLSTRRHYPSEEAYFSFGAASYPVLASGNVFRSQIEHVRKDGTIIWVDVSGAILDRESGESLWGFIDITERKHTESALKDSERRLSAVFQASPIGIVISKVADGQILDVNDAALRLYGYTRDEAIGRTVAELGTYANPAQRAELVRRLGDHGSVDCFLIDYRTRSGNLGMLEVSGRVIKLQGEKCLLAMMADVSVREHAGRKIHEQAFRDSLTQLPNRRLLRDRLNQAMAASKRSACYGALMFIDLDNFKPLNDTHGHAVGDLLLIEVADRLKACVRDMDTVARFGGDEFVVLLTELNAESAESISRAEAIAEKIRSALSKPYSLTFKREGEANTIVEHHCTASIGVAMFIAHEAGQDDIFEWADTAMYEAKDAGRNLIRFHDSRA